jgi:hypothetical protein
MSLPLAVGTTLATIPATVPYVTPPPNLAEAWRTTLADLPGLKVGLAWAGSQTNTLDRYRSCRLESLAPLLDLPAGDVTFFSLQKGAGSEQLHDSPRFAERVIDHTREFTDWADTAAFVANLELVISVDTGVVHLAGAIGKPVWTMLSTASEWRWLEQSRADSPWYPTMRLFRQERLHDWAGVARQVADELRKLRPS